MSSSVCSPKHAVTSCVVPTSALLLQQWTSAQWEPHTVTTRLVGHCPAFALLSLWSTSGACGLCEVLRDVCVTECWLLFVHRDARLWISPLQSASYSSVLLRLHHPWTQWWRWCRALLCSHCSTRSTAVGSAPIPEGPLCWVSELRDPTQSDGPWPISKTFPIRLQQWCYTPRGWSLLYWEGCC